MLVSKSQKRAESHKRAVMKYMKNNYDRVDLKLTKGKKEILKTHATNRNESLNGFINRAINEALERDNVVYMANMQ